MNYIEVRFYNASSLNEVIIAWLGENNFDMFEERNDGLNAYITEKNYDEKNLREVISSIPDSIHNIRFETSLIKDQNWNKKWESNFEPVDVAGKVYIRAPFHDHCSGYKHEIVIEPKMSFGTGHHATTTLMVKLMLDFDFNKKNVLDMGCGTGVLAILAYQSGAKEVTAIDIDEWAYTNSIENCERNQASEITVKQGNVGLIKNCLYDVILANINRNILLEDIPAYVESLKQNGALFLSGILTGDKEIIINRCIQSGLSYINEAFQDNWLAIQFKK